MKPIVTTIIALAILLASCAEATESADTKSEDSNTKQKQAEAIEEEVLLPEVSEVEEDHRYDNLSNESATSECHIVSHFTDMDITYVTVDFVTIEEDIENGGYKIINDNSQLRTFVVNEEYLDMYTDTNVSIEKMFENASNDAEMLFLITVEDGLVTEFYEMDTASIYQ